MKINVLGAEYIVIERDRCEDKQLDDKDGYCDDSVREIITARLEPEPDSKKIWMLSVKRFCGTKSFMRFSPKAVFPATAIGPKTKSL